MQSKSKQESLTTSRTNTFQVNDIQIDEQNNQSNFGNLLTGKIEIQYLLADNEEVYVLVRSGTILKPLVDFFGPLYIRIDYLEEDENVTLRLWDKV